MTEPRDPDQAEPIPDVRNDPVPEQAGPDDDGQPETHEGEPE